MRGKETTLDMSRLIPFYKKIWQDAANFLQVDFNELANGVWQMCSEDKRTLIHNYKVQIDDPVILDMAGNKPLCYRLLKEKGLPVPEYQVFTICGFESAEKFMTMHNGSLFVVKPARGTSGSRGITTHIRSFQECRRAGALASLYGDEIIVERLIAGESYRLLILDGKMIHATRRQGFRIKGDGQSTIWQLIEKENKSRQMKKLKNIMLDRDIGVTLPAQGLGKESIPGVGQEVLIKSYDFPKGIGSEVRTIFNENVTDLVCQDLITHSVRAAGILDSKFAGVDIITLDPTKPLRETGGAIIEINTTPGLHHHYNLMNDQYPPPAVHVLEYLLQYSDPVCRDAEKKHGPLYQEV